MLPAFILEVNRKAVLKGFSEYMNMVEEEDERELKYKSSGPSIDDYDVGLDDGTDYEEKSLQRAEVLIKQLQEEIKILKEQNAAITQQTDVQQLRKENAQLKTVQ